MNLMLMMSMIIMTTVTLILMMMMNISKKTHNDREKTSPFECGFDPKTSARLPFSLHFFLIAIIFLIFDVEITMLLPLMMTMKMSNLITLTSMMMMFSLILLLGLYHEWNQGMLNWTI